MARNLNRCTFTGNLGADPDVRYMPDSTCTVTFSLANNQDYKTKAGEERKHVEWIRVTAFGRRAEVVRDYLHKGDKVYVEGRWRTRKWQDKQNIDRYTTELHMDNLEMLGGKRRDENHSSSMPAPSQGPGTAQDPRARQAPIQQQAANLEPPEFDDDIPF